MAKRGIDELNVSAGVKMRSMPYTEYFGGMRLPDADKKRRIDLAESLEALFSFVLSLAAVQDGYGAPDWGDIRRRLVSGYREVADGAVGVDAYLGAYIDGFAENAVRSTKGNTGDAYTFSLDRAMFMAENESSTLFNYRDYAAALDSGCRKKQWLTMHDDRVRESHWALDGKTIGIDDVFIVGDSLMRYPRDTGLLASAGQVIGCRCTARYM